MRVDLRRFKVSRVSVGGLGVSGKVDEPEEGVVEVECGEALGEGGFPPLHYVINVPLYY